MRNRQNANMLILTHRLLSWCSSDFKLLALNTTPQILAIYDDVIKWKDFQRCWPFVREFIGHWLILLTKASDVELWCLHWSAPECARTKGWVNNRDTGDLRRNHVHYDVIVMLRTHCRLQSMIRCIAGSQTPVCKHYIIVQKNHTLMHNTKLLTLETINKRKYSL